MNIPLIQEPSKDDINTSLIAVRRLIDELNGAASRLSNLLSEADKKIVALQNETKALEDSKVNKSDVVNDIISGNMNPVTSNAVANSNAMPVDTVTSGNMHSVTSNALFWALLYKDTLYVTDTRDSNYSPSWYFTYKGHQTTQEFKLCSAIDSPFTGTFCTLITITPWADSSGGYPTQIAIDTFGGGSMKYRYPIDMNTWGSWQKIANQNDLSAKMDLIIIDGIANAGDFENALNANDPRLPDGFHAVWLRAGSWSVALYLKTMSPNAYCGYLYWSYGQRLTARYNMNGGTFVDMTFNS